MRLCVLLCALLFASVAAGVNDGEFGLQPQHVVAEELGHAIGYPRISENKQPDPIFSEAQMKEIISHKGYDDDKINPADYPNQCARDLVRVSTSIGEQWANLMIDADGKMPAGVLYGNTIWAGSVRECHAVQAPPDPTGKQSVFVGKYCTVSWRIANFNISSGLCVPDSCNESDFFIENNVKLLQTSRRVVLDGLAVIKNPLSGLNTLTRVACQAKETKYSDGAVAVLTVLYICLFLVITGTSLTTIEAIFQKSSGSFVQADAIRSLSTEIRSDKATKNNNADNIGPHPNEFVQLLPQTKSNSRIFGHVRNFLKCFCLITNGSKILDTSDKGGKEFRCLHGIRFLSMAWVTLDHTYLLVIGGSLLGNVVDAVNIADDLLSQIVLQGSYAVDSFFVKSGFLLTCLFLREMNAKRGKISWLAFYLHRYWRLTPVYAIVIAFHTTLTWHLVSGPLSSSTSYVDGCKKSWWWNLLYINNFAPQEDTCLRWSWYLANDMQFYAISPLFLYTLWRRPNVGLRIVFSLFCGSWIANFAISYYYDLDAGFASLTTSFDNEATSWQKALFHFTKLYIKPYTRIGPYLIGVFLAYFYSKLNGRKNFLSKRSIAIGWTASIVLGLYTTFGLYHATPSRLGSAFINAFCHCCFSISLSWVIFACLTGHSGPVNTILSHPIFIPLSRITYCAYLIHPIVMTVYYASMPSMLIMTPLQMAMLFFGFLVLSYGIAFATTLMFESPTMAIERWLRGTAKLKTEGARA